MLYQLTRVFNTIAVSSFLAYNGTISSHRPAKFLPI
jgi:hypothetical protein